MNRFLILFLILFSWNSQSNDLTPEEIYDQTVLYYSVNPQIPSKKDYNKLKGILKKRRDHIAKFKKQFYQKPIVTIAVLNRAGKKTPLDLSKPNKFLLGDKIELSEGVYNQLPDITEPGVIVVGQGKDKTFLTSGQDGQKTFMLNGTGLWDLTLVDVRMMIKEDPLWLANGKAIGNFQVATQRPSQYPFESVLSDLSLIDMEFVKYFNVFTVIPGDSFLGHHFLSITDPTGQFNNLYRGLSKFWDYNFIAMKTNVYYKYITALEKDVDKSSGFLVYKMNITPEVLKPFNEIIIPMIEEQDKAGASSDWVDARRAAKKMTRRFAYYAYEKGLLTRPTFDSKKSSSLRQKALVQEQKGNYAVATLLLDEASKADFFTKLLEDEKTASRMFNPLLKNYAFECAVKKLDSEKYMTSMLYQSKDFLKKEYPHMRMPETSDDCQITIWETGGKSQISYAQGKLLAVEAVYEDSPETKMRKAEVEMMRAAANRAAEKAQMAKFNAAGEAAKDTFKKMYEGRVRVEQWGDRQVMVHGSGNWTGQASLASQNAINSANAQAAALNSQARTLSQQPQGQIKVGENKTYETTMTTSSTAQGFMMAKIYGQKIQKEGSVSDATINKTCDTKEIMNGNFKESTNCRESRSSSYNYHTYYQDNFHQTVRQALNSGRIDRILAKANSLLQSSSAEDKLEGYFLKQTYTKEKLDEQILKEGMAIFGRPVHKDELRTSGFLKWSI